MAIPTFAELFRLEKAAAKAAQLALQTTTTTEVATTTNAPIIASLIVHTQSPISASTFPMTNHSTVLQINLGFLYQEI